MARPASNPSRCCLPGSQVMEVAPGFHIFIIINIIIITIIIIIITTIIIIIIIIIIITTIIICSWLTLCPSRRTVFKRW
jgi:hypothetical protein